MESTKIGIREFRENLSAYLLESDAPIAITRHGDTVGYFIPTRRRRTETEREAFQQATARWQSVLAANGITEDEAIKDFKRLRTTRSK